LKTFLFNSCFYPPDWLLLQRLGNFAYDALQIWLLLLLGLLLLNKKYKNSDNILRISKQISSFNEYRPTATVMLNSMT